MIRLFSCFYSEWIEIRDGKAFAKKGRMTQRVLADISDVISESISGVGVIRSTGNGRYQFSSNIPASTHQKLRNILTSR